MSSTWLQNRNTVNQSSNVSWVQPKVKRPVPTTPSSSKYPSPNLPVIGCHLLPMTHFPVSLIKLTYSGSTFPSANKQTSSAHSLKTNEIPRPKEARGWNVDINDMVPSLDVVACMPWDRGILLRFPLHWIQHILWAHTFVYHIFIHFNSFHPHWQIFPFFIHSSSNLPTLYNVEK